MQRDLDVVARCHVCKTATAVLEYVYDLDDEGRNRVIVQRVNLPHTARMCSTQQALMKEEWPTLW